MCSFFLTNFTLSVPNEIQKTISNLPWRSIFTTNYDDVIEQSALEDKFQPYSPRTQDLDVRIGQIPIYYLHGRARDLYEESNLKGFVLSESDYLDISRHNNDLYNRLFGDVHAASEIVFIGYSLKDLEIASRLFSIKSIYRKVSIITSNSASALDILRLKKFGTVFNIGSEKFAENIKEYFKSHRESPKLNVSFIKPLDTMSSKRDVSANDFSDLVLTGQFNYSAYLAQLSASERSDRPESEYYCVDRIKSIEKIFLDISSGLYNKFLIAADLGNGKSIFLK